MIDATDQQRQNETQKAKYVTLMGRDCAFFAQMVCYERQGERHVNLYPVPLTVDLESCLS